jgi:hypothetical protein
MEHELFLMYYQIDRKKDVSSCHKCGQSPFPSLDWSKLCNGNSSDKKVNMCVSN